jgi:hypothetical protein
MPLNPATAPALGHTALTVENLLNTFVKQSYLEKAANAHYTVMPGQEKAQKQRKGRTEAQQTAFDALGAKLGSGAGGDPSMEWRWGARADREVGETNVAEFAYECVLPRRSLRFVSGRGTDSSRRPTRRPLARRSSTRPSCATSSARPAPSCRWP